MGVEFFVYGSTKHIKIIPHFVVWDMFLYDFYVGTGLLLLEHTENAFEL